MKGQHLPASSFLAISLLAFVVIAASCSTGSPQSTFDAVGEVSRKQLNLFYIIFWAAAVVFVFVEGLLLVAVIKFRRKRGQGDPEQIHGSHKLEIVWTVIPAIILAVIAVPTITTLVDLSSPPEGDALNVTVVGHQWFWEFQYPDLGIVTANELHIPTGKVINFTLQSKDVIHSFWVPKLAGKQDVIPNRDGSLWFIADEPGTYFGQCAEFCGVAHAQMRLRVIAQSPDEFEKWATDFLRPALDPKGLAKDGAQLFTEKGCIACHTVKDNPVARGVIGPSLTHFGLRSTIAAGVMEDDRFGENLTRWLTDPEEVKPGNIMGRNAPLYNDPGQVMTNKEIAALVVYLRGLEPDLSKDPIVGEPTPGPTPTPGGVPEPGQGDSASGQTLFASQGCSACHSVGSNTIVGPGLGGIGTRAATRKEDLLTGGQYLYQSIIDPSAYVVQGFSDGIMLPIFGDTLSEQEINDLIAYLLTLK